MTTSKVVAPWTSDQVASLNGYQESGKFHPFTCGNPDCPRIRDRPSVLIARVPGWVCPMNCGYQQDWAHDWMANGSWKDMSKTRGTAP